MAFVIINTAMIFYSLLLLFRSSYFKSIFLKKRNFTASLYAVILTYILLSSYIVLDFIVVF